MNQILDLGRVMRVFWYWPASQLHFWVYLFDRERFSFSSDSSGNEGNV